MFILLVRITSKSPTLVMLILALITGYKGGNKISKY